MYNNLILQVLQLIGGCQFGLAHSLANEALPAGYVRDAMQHPSGASVHGLFIKAVEVLNRRVEARLAWQHRQTRGMRPGMMS